MDRDAYLTHLSRYIHWNPVAAGLVKRPSDWTFSSYRDDVSLRVGTLPITDLILSQFPSPHAYQTLVKRYDTDNLNNLNHLLFNDD